MTNHKKRMEDIGRFILPPLKTDARKAFDSWRANLADDLDFQKFKADNMKRIRTLIELQQENGSGLPLDTAIREFHLEYNSRTGKYGLNEQPSSFNVLEAFLEFLPPLSVFSIRPERDYIFSFSDFLDFVTSDAPLEPHMHAAKLLPEGIIHSFLNWERPRDLDFSILNGKSFGVGGISMIRHGTELSMLMLAGEICDELPDAQSFGFENAVATPGKETLIPDPSLKREAVPLLNDVGMWRVLALTRLDLSDQTQQVRYVLYDIGDNYLVKTDDPSVYFGPKGNALFKDAERFSIQSTQEVDEYATLFELCKTCIYLPFFFEEHEDNIQEERHRTRYGERPRSERRSLKESWPKKERLAERHVQVLHSEVGSVGATRTYYQAPEFHIETTGFWKTLPHGSQGTDKHGRVVHGKTWVERRLTWRENQRVSDEAITAVNIKRQTGQTGYIYIMRSAMHPKNVFKVGHTTRNSDVRADEVSRGSGVPDRLFPLYDWEVNNSAHIEAIIHQRLSNYRLSQSREFFQLPLRQLMSIIEEVIIEVEGPL